MSFFRHKTGTITENPNLDIFLNLLDIWIIFTRNCFSLSAWILESMVQLPPNTAVEVLSWCKAL